MKFKQMLQYVTFMIYERYYTVFRSFSVEHYMCGAYSSKFSLDGHALEDTLIVTCVSAAGNLYEVIYTVQETVQEQENVRKVLTLTSDKWLGFYDNRVRHLVELNMDRIVSFIPEEKTAVYEGRQLVK